MKVKSIESYSIIRNGVPYNATITRLKNDKYGNPRYEVTVNISFDGALQNYNDYDSKINKVSVNRCYRGICKGYETPLQIIDKFIGSLLKTDRLRLY